jgi:cell volume regulation protein A
VLASLLTQGTTIALVARKLGVALPDPSDEREQRSVFRDFGLDPLTSVAEVCDFYSLPVPADAELSLCDWMRAELRRPPVVGDCVHLGQAMLAVRELQDGRISRIGLGLGPSP